MARSLRHITPFAISSAEALAAFRAWAKTQILFPRSIVDGYAHKAGQSIAREIRIRPSLLPFFCFDATFEVVRRNEPWSRSAGEWLSVGTRQFEAAQPEMQVRESLMNLFARLGVLILMIRAGIV